MGILKEYAECCRAILLLALLTCACPLILSAQDQHGGGVLTGHVRGPGGTSVPGATVRLTEPATGVRKETWTDEQGNYSLAGITPGTYKLEVSLVGFRTDVREPVPVAAGKTLKVNIALVLPPPEGVPAVGQANGSGRNGLPADLQAAAAQVQLRMRNNGVEASPLGMGNGNSSGSVRFSDGSSAPGSPQGDMGSPETDASASASNSFLLSGSTGITASMPGDDDNRMRERWQEIRRTRDSQTAPGFGGGPGEGSGGGPGGGLGAGSGPEMMAVFISGGRGGNWMRGRPQINRIRGNIFEEYSNSALNAHPYPLNVAESPQIPAYHEQFGGSIGGPLVIPRIYNGSNKTSFFINYGLQRSRNPFDSFSTVPTQAQRGGDFSQAVISSGPLAGTVPTIYDPASNPLGPRTPFQANQIPTSRFDPAAVGLLKYIPLPNLPGSVQNFHLQEALPSSSDRIMGRIGHQFSSKDSLNAFYFFNSSRSQSVGSFPELTQNSSTRSQNLNLSETHTFSQHFINTLAANFNRQRSSLLNPFAFNQDIAGELGITGVSTAPLDWGVPLAQFTNFTGLNDAIPSLTRNQTVRVFDIAILNSGKHNIHFGGEIRRVQLNTLTDPDARGTFTFSGYATSDFNPQGLLVSGTGIDFADFLLGLPQTTSVRFGTSSNYLRSWVYSGFMMDDWRLNSKVTLNYGLRYEYDQPFTEKYGHLSDLTFGPGFSSASVVTAQTPASRPTSLLGGDANNLSPRLGVAYRPWTKRRLVFRGGYGVFYDSGIYSRLVPNLANQPPFAQASTLLTSPQQVLTLQNGFPTLPPNILRNTYAVDPHFLTPYAQTWNFSVEDEIARDLILSVGYVGTKGTKLDVLLAPNQSTSGTTQSPTSGLALSNALAFTYETSGAASIYHGLQVGLRRQFHGGFSMSGNYTYSKSIDNAASVGGSGRTVAQDYLDLQAERGLSAFDVRHRLLINYTYEFPFGERRHWLSRGGALAGVLGSWQVNGVTTIQSGNPYTARVLGNLSSIGGTAAISNLRADATGQPVSLPGSDHTTQEFFNVGAFSLPPVGQFGDAGRNTITGPGTVNFNMSLSRFITLSREKGARLEFRIDSNNAFNTPNFSGLATVVNGQGFGRITSVKSMRSLDFALRLRF